MREGIAHTQIRLLIVEDEEDDFVLTSALLARSNSPAVIIDWAETPERAREYFQERRHDLCLIDFRLGSESGLNLVRDAQQAGFDAPIIMLTGQEDAHAEIAAAQAGAVDYLTKDNLGREQLLRAIRYALARREIQREHDELMQAESSNKAKTEFLATLSHEIRTPLTAMMGFTELLSLQYQGKDSDLDYKLGVIKRNGEHLLSLLNDTLDLSKIEAGKLELDVSAIVLQDFAQDLAQTAREMAAAKSLDFSFEMLGALPRDFESDAMRLRQVLLNLLGNAIKFTERGQVTLSISLQSSKGKPTLVFEVRDTGIGIDPRKLGSIFDPFSRGPGGTSTDSGLGLTISQKLAHKLGGEIQVSSVEGEGSVFTLCVDPGTVIENPAASAGGLAELAVAPLDPSATAFSGTVLVVDDMDDVRQLLTGLLQGAGLEVIAVPGGEQALAQLQQQGAAITAVLMDLNMPDKDGYQTLQLMREHGHQQPVIALTAAGPTGARERCLEAGFVDFLAKPLTQKSLLKALMKIPAANSARDGQRTAARHSPAHAHPHSYCDVLVVEDNADANAALCMLLEALGYHAEAALNAEDALDLYQRRHPMSVIADVHLGKTSGMDLLRLLHDESANSRFYVVSGEDPSRSEVSPDYVEARLTKPVTLTMLQRYFPARGGRAA